MQKSIVISITAILTFYSLFALYGDVLFFYHSGDTSFFRKDTNPGEMCFKEAHPCIAGHFVADSEFNNINASVSLFEEHRNVISECKYNIGNFPALTFSEFLSEITFKSILTSFHISILNSFKQMLDSNLFSFRF